VLTGLELVQYALDQMASVDELARFVAKAHVAQLGVALHFFACDRGGECVVIEGDSEHVDVTRQPSGAWQALANRPIAEDTAALEPSGWAAWFGFSHTSGSSSERLERVAHGLSGVQHVNSAFALLERVASRATRWQVVWDLTRGVVHFRDRAHNLTTMRFSLDSREACDGAPRVQRIGGGEPGLPFRWNEQEARLAAPRVLAQLRASGPASRGLLAEITRGMRSSSCQVSE
jgi:hypothetical protein